MICYPTLHILSYTIASFFSLILISPIPYSLSSSHLLLLFRGISLDRMGELEKAVLDFSKVRPLPSFLGFLPWFPSLASFVGFLPFCFLGFLPSFLPSLSFDSFLHVLLPSHPPSLTSFLPSLTFFHGFPSRLLELLSSWLSSISPSFLPFHSFIHSSLLQTPFFLPSLTCSLLFLAPSLLPSLCCFLLFLTS